MISIYSAKHPLSHSSKRIVDFSENFTRELCNLKQWFQGNRLSLNLRTTLEMVIVPWPNLKKISDKKAQPPTFVIDCSQIEIVENAKHFGVQLDQYLVSDEHVRFMCAKLSRALGSFKHAKKLLPQETLAHFYRGIVEPHFRYCNSL